MFETITPEKIKNDILSALETDMDIREGSYTNDLVAPVALELYKMYQALNSVVPIVYVDETSGAYIDKRCSYYGIVRKSGAKARAELSVTGTDGTVIPVGKVFLDSSGLRYAVTEQAVIENQTATVRVQAQEVGSRYNLPPDCIKYQLESLTGLRTCSNPTSAQGGADAETDASLVKRLYDYLRTPATSGNIGHYKLWATACEGIGDARVFPTYFGPGTVRVLVGDMDRAPVDSARVKICEDSIKSQCPIGATVTVQTVQGLEVDVTAELKLTAETDMAKITESFRRVLEGYLKDIRTEQFQQVESDGQTSSQDISEGKKKPLFEVSVNKINYLLMGLKGVQDVVNGSLLICGSNQNLILGDDQVPVVGNDILLTASTTALLGEEGV